MTALAAPAGAHPAAPAGACDRRTLYAPDEFSSRLAAAGIKLVEFNPVNPLPVKAGWDVNQRDHR